MINIILVVLLAIKILLFTHSMHSNKLAVCEKNYVIKQGGGKWLTNAKCVEWVSVQ